MRVILITYRDLKGLMPEYMARHEKYFKIPVTLASEEDYSEGKYDHIKPPCGETIVNSDFGKSLRWALENVTDKYVIIMLIDYFITKEVDISVIERICEYMTEQDNILRCEIGTNRGFGSIKEVDTYKGVSIREEKHFFAASLCPGVWDREKYLQIIKGDTAWDVETKTNGEFLKTGWRSIGVYPEPMDYINYIRGRDINNPITG